MNYSHITMRTEEKLVVMVMEEMSPVAFRRHRRRGAGSPFFFFFLGPPGERELSPRLYLAVVFCFSRLFSEPFTVSYIPGDP